ncbi:MAG TPA: hypothetical protein VK745_06710 [Polyangiaceae bacterium]|jgi:hypothetical protein|nr:hypothetical protein [Polyangiaceae bacterium]
MKRGLAVSLAVLLCALSGALNAEPVAVDRAVVRFVAPETGGARRPRFVFQRELAFEARLEALSDPDRSTLGDAPYRERHVSAALDRHIAETILGTLRIEPEPTQAELEHQSELAHRMLSDRAGGEDALDDARRAEGISDREFGRFLAQKARASLYLDRMVTPMLQPSEAELRSIHKTTNTPFANAPFDEIRPALLRWYVSRRLNAALAAFFENARSRIEVAILH